MSVNTNHLAFQYIIWLKCYIENFIVAFWNQRQIISVSYCIAFCWDASEYSKPKYSLHLTFLSWNELTKPRTKINWHLIYVSYKRWYPCFLPHLNLKKSGQDSTWPIRNWNEIIFAFNSQFSDFYFDLHSY